MQKTETRKAEAIALLAHSGELSVTDLSNEFSISLPTARRLCASLTEEGLAIRTHGGIRYLPEVRGTYSFDAVRKEFMEEKKRIAKYSSTLVKDHQVVFFESGSTVMECAYAVAERIRSGELSNLIVFTNSLISLNIFSPICEVTLVGGTFRENRQAFVGYLSERMLRSLNFDYCFIGADALSLEDGAMALDIDTVRIDELLVKRADNSVLLVHSDKFYKHSLISFADVTSLSAIITDAKLNEEYYNQYTKAGAYVVRV